MNFDFSDEQNMFGEAMRSLLQESGDAQRIRARVEAGRFDDETWRRLAEAGAFAIAIPESHGGMGLGFVDLALVFEEHGRALVGPPVMDTILAGDLIARCGSAEQKDRFLPGLATGALKATIAFTETGGGYDPRDVSLTAEKTAEGWRLTGSKILVAQADLCGLFVVAMRLGAQGPVALALVERERAGLAIRAQGSLDLSGRFHEVGFDGLELQPADLLFLEAPERAVAHLFDAAATAAALMMNGACVRVLDDVVAYVAQREQFGRPIGSFQAIKHRCADMATALDVSRNCAYYAAWAMAEGEAERAKAASMAKSFAGETSRFICNEGVQLHGGVGFTWELGLHFFLRRARALEQAWGDVAWHRERVLSEALNELGIA